MAAAPAPLELLLAALGLGIGARRHRGKWAAVIGASLLAAGATTMSFAAGPGWYLGASAGWATSDFGSGDLDNHLTSLGYSPTSVSVDNDDNGWKIFGGYQFTPNWAAEAAYVDLGEVKSTVEGSIDDSRIPTLLKDAANGHGYLGRGVALSGIGMWPVNPQVSPFLRLGAFFWKADIEVKDEVSGQSYSRDESGADLMGGIGIQFTPNPQWELRAEYEYYRIGSGSANFLSLGVGFHF